MRQLSKQLDIYNALFCVFLGLLIMGESARISSAGTYDPLGPSRYPMALGALIAVMGGMLLLPAFRDKTKEGEKEPFSLKRFLPLMGIVACCAFYLVFLNILGFVLVNSAMLMGCAAILGERNVKKMALFSVSTSVVLYILFRYVLGVLLTPIPLINL